MEHALHVLKTAQKLRMLRFGIPVKNMFFEAECLIAPGLDVILKACWMKIEGNVFQMASGKVPWDPCKPSL